jgi:hypothetical protein
MDKNKIHEDGIAASPANAMGGSSSSAGTGAIDTVDPLLKSKKLRNILTRKTLEDIRATRK